MSFEIALPLPPPPKMTRRMISVTAPQDAVLQAEAARLGLSYADLIRRAPDASVSGRRPGGVSDDLGRRALSLEESVMTETIEPRLLSRAEWVRERRAVTGERLMDGLVVERSAELYGTPEELDQA